MNEITIGIPTYNRPELLEKLIKDLLKQTYPNFFIYVSVNKSKISEKKYLKISKKFKNKNIFFFFQSKLLEPAINFNFLKKKCKTKFFMWLADDDRLSYSTIEILYNEISKNKKLVTIMPNWLHLIGPGVKIMKKPVQYNSNFFFFRLIKLLFIGDDCSVYGMHRTSYIKQLNFEHRRYFFPNKEVRWNNAYLLVIQLISFGKVILTKNKSAIWINDDYSQIKHHSKSSQDKFLIKNIKLIILKINFYFFVLIKLKSLKKYFILFLVIMFLPFVASYKYYYYVIQIFKNYIQKKLKKI